MSASMEKRLLAQTADRIAALERERDLLRASLRDHCIVYDSEGQFRYCAECGMEADDGRTWERHALGCLAILPEVES